MTENMVIPSSIDSHTVSTFGEKLFVVINDGKENKKFEVAIRLIYEMGKIVGGLTKYYAKNNKE